MVYRHLWEGCGQSPGPLTLPLPAARGEGRGGAFLLLSPLAGRGRVRGGGSFRRAAEICAYRRVRSGRQRAEEKVEPIE